MHRFAGAVASLTAALLLTFLLVEDTRPTGSLVVPVLVAVLVVAALTWGATTEAARSAWSDRRRGAGMRRLGEDCLRLAEELDRFLAERGKTTPRPPPETNDDDVLTLQEQREAKFPDWDGLAEHREYVMQLEEHEAETMRLYEKRFAAAVFRAIHGLHDAGLIFGGEARVLPYPSKPSDVADLVYHLGRFGRRLAAPPEGLED